jgi:cell division septum initiation protein DivIVA
MQTGKDRAALLAENRKLRKENEYLAHRIAYMESLAKVMGFNPGSTRKKNGLKPSTSSSSPAGRGT